VDISDLVEFLGTAESDFIELSETAKSIKITRPNKITDAQPGEFTFCGHTARNPLALIQKTNASLIVLDRSILVENILLSKIKSKAIILSDNARLDFIKLLEKFFAPKHPVGIHPTAVIALSAIIAPDVYLGPYCTVGEYSKIGANSVIHAGVHIYDHVDIGANVTIHSGAVIGGDGFGFQRNEQGEVKKFPHIGGVVIEDDVEIFPLSHVARGTLGATKIGRGTKIDVHVHVGHNIQIGKHCVITAHAMLAADAIGDYSWIAPSACLRDRILIGSETTIGMGAVVTKDVPDGSTVFGAPARQSKEQKRLLVHWEEIIHESDGEM
jgi:UDP-3-O-[3-hydroxymyristoyl] glucosamine N-acyltransferase